jgi:predicted RNA-binding protein associated with RNAse of E/G family
VSAEVIPLPRSLGSVVNVIERTVRYKDGQIYRLDDFELSDQGLYYRRPEVNSAKVTSHECWLIPSLNMSLSRWDWRTGFDGHFEWYIEPDLVIVVGGEVRVLDGFIDVEVYEGVRYEVDDIDEFTEALGSGELPLSEGLEVLTSFHRISKELRQNGFVGAELLSRLAPGLPRQPQSRAH